ncbi:MAG: hypothetical protein BMS9Abin17_0408 [Acidimicrobiia bacterium]|nr:MAG: hypothetical protein BMS9Abin17_0408 [Acidimicrobiia bacterium]
MVEGGISGVDDTRLISHNLPHTDTIRETYLCFVSMHVLVATAGALSPEPVVEFARHLIGGTGSVTVTTVVEVPREFLEDLGADDWHPLHDAHSKANTDEVVANYLAERGHRLTDPIKQALETARIPCEVRVLEGADPAAAISAAAHDLAVDVVLLGATKRIFDVDAWESVSARVMQEAGRPVLVVPQARKDSDDDEHVDSFQETAEPAPSI